MMMLSNIYSNNTSYDARFIPISRHWHGE